MADNAPATLAASSRSPRTRRTNRVTLFFIGLLVALIGAGGLLLGLGVLGTDRKGQNLLSPQTRDFAASNAGWFWPVLGVVGLLIALLGLRWLIIQLRSNRLRSLDLVRDRQTGNTTVDTGAVCDALAVEIQDYDGVDAAGAQLIGKPGEPTLLVRVRLDGRGDLSDVRRKIETDGIPHLRQALDLPALPARVELALPAVDARAVA